MPNSRKTASLKPDPLVVLLLGPTGSGKTALSLSLGERFHGEILSCDSVAVYRGMESGNGEAFCRRAHAAAASPDRCGQARRAFHRGGVQCQARKVLRDVSARSMLPIVTGGTGLYLRALIEGLFAGPVRHQELRERLRYPRRNVEAPGCIAF